VKLVKKEVKAARVHKAASGGAVWASGRENGSILRY